MRCAHCDLPLSPTNPARVCPRCHMPMATGTNAATKSKHTPVVQPPSWGDEVALLSSLQPTPYPQPGQMWDPTPLPTPALAVSSPQFSATAMRRESQSLPQAKKVSDRKTRTTTSNLGFIIAGVCVLTGGLLLILVYYMAAGLSPSTAQTQSIAAGNSVATTTRHLTSTPVVSTPTLKPTPATGAFPAQQYITNPQMASEVNTSTAQIGQTATTFTVGQRVYVTFTLHPNGRNGAVCLLWYSNAKMFSHFEFAVSPNSTVAYSYTYYATSGRAYVEIYWASDVSCSDKMLAQRVNFTVVN